VTRDDINSSLVVFDLPAAGDDAETVGTGGRVDSPRFESKKKTQEIFRYI